jgi:pilus assembly protein Flp/PilA
MSKLFTRVIADESGASAAEYAILVASVAVVILAAVGVMGTGMNTLFTNLGAKLSTLLGSI